MHPEHAVLGFLNSNGRIGFGVTNAPARYIHHTASGQFNSQWIEQDATLVRAVPVRDSEQALEWRDRWNDAPATQAANESARLSVPPEIIERLINLSHADHRRERFALALISEHGQLPPDPFEHDQIESRQEGEPFKSPFVPLPRHREPSIQAGESAAELGIKLAIFDLDRTLVNTRALEAAREARNWDHVMGRIHEVKPLSCWGGCAAHQLPGLLAERGIKIALISRAPRFYVDTLVKRFGIRADWTIAPCPDGKYEAFRKAMETFRSAPDETVAFGDDASDFTAARYHGVVSLGNPWTSTVAGVAPDIAWMDSTLLMSQEDWRLRLGYLGETDPDRAVWHRGSLLPFAEDAYALGRYFPTSRYQELREGPLVSGILSGKENPNGDPHILKAFGKAVRHLAAHEPIDVVLSVPPHPWSKDRFSPYRRLAAAETGATGGVAVQTVVEMPHNYKRINKKEKEHLNTGRFRIDESLRDQTVLLIDDVVTTGSTLEGLKIAAQNAGAKKVIQIAFGFTQK